VALLSLLGAGTSAGHVRDGRIAYAHVGDGKRFQVYSTTSDGACGNCVWTKEEPSWQPLR
jgi:hypothetical protein